MSPSSPCRASKGSFTSSSKRKCNMPQDSPAEIIPSKPVGAKPNGVPFSSNEVRLSMRDWVVALVLIGGLSYTVPAVWQRIEPFTPGPDYRIPFSLGSDYWMYDRYCDVTCADKRTVLIGDSVIWGHYVASEETLVALSQRGGRRPEVRQSGRRWHSPDRHVGTAGVLRHAHCFEGRDPAMQPAVDEFCRGTTSEPTKHFRSTIPNWSPSFIPGYRATRNRCRAGSELPLGVTCRCLGWTEHLRIAYFGNTDLPNWTMEHPYEDPLAPSRWNFRRPTKPRHPSRSPSPGPRPVARLNAEWVELDGSLQWQFFRRAVETLRRRGNRVFVLVGPFNEHMLTNQSRQVYEERKRGVEKWLKQEGVAHFVPPACPASVTPMPAIRWPMVMPCWRKNCWRANRSDSFRLPRTERTSK